MTTSIERNQRASDIYTAIRQALKRLAQQRDEALPYLRALSNLADSQIQHIENRQRDMQLEP
jgi:hypothetical protein